MKKKTHPNPTLDFHAPDYRHQSPSPAGLGLLPPSVTPTSRTAEASAHSLLVRGAKIWIENGAPMGFRPFDLPSSQETKYVPLHQLKLHRTRMHLSPLYQQRPRTGRTTSPARRPRRSCAGIQPVGPALSVRRGTTQIKFGRIHKIKIKKRTQTRFEHKTARMGNLRLYH